MKKLSNLGCVGIAILNIAVYGGVYFLFSSCQQKSEQCEKLLVPDTIEIRNIGTVVSPENETCTVQEVVKVHNYCIDYESSFSYQPLVRRIICPSRLNGSSTVTDDGTKFHREIIK